MTSLSRRRATARAGRAKLQAELDEFHAEQDAERRPSASRGHRAPTNSAREAEQSRPKLTADDVAGARIVRVYGFNGWMSVVRTSAKAITVAGPMGDFRVAITKVLEVRS